MRDHFAVLACCCSQCRRSSCCSSSMSGSFRPSGVSAKMILLISSQHLSLLLLLPPVCKYCRVRAPSTISAAASLDSSLLVITPAGRDPSGSSALATSPSEVASDSASSASSKRPSISTSWRSSVRILEHLQHLIPLGQLEDFRVSELLGVFGCSNVASTTLALAVEPPLHPSQVSDHRLSVPKVAPHAMAVYGE